MPNVLKHATCSMTCPVTNANNTLIEKHEITYKSIEVYLSTMSCDSVLIIEKMGVQRKERELWGQRDQGRLHRKGGIWEGFRRMGIIWKVNVRRAVLSTERM